MESCWRGDRGASRGQFQELTARAKPSLLSPSEVHILCRGQSSITQSSAGSTFSTVDFDEPMALHILAAALWDQSSVSGVSQSQYHALCSSGAQVTEAQCPEGQGGSMAAGSGSRGA